MPIRFAVASEKAQNSVGSFAVPLFLGGSSSVTKRVTKRVPQGVVKVPVGSML